MCDNRNLVGVYQQTERANGQVWVMEKVLEHLSPVWSQLLVA
jgi:hypothetical protein